MDKILRGDWICPTFSCDAPHLTNNWCENFLALAVDIFALRMCSSIVLDCVPLHHPAFVRPTLGSFPSSPPNFSADTCLISYRNGEGRTPLE